MCFEFGSCFGGGRREDYGGERSAAQKAQHGGGRRRNRRSSAYYGVAGNKVPPPATYHIHNQPTPVFDEAGHKAYHDGARKPDRTEVISQVGYGPYSHGKAWHNKVGDDTGHTYSYTAQPHEAAADRWQNDAMGYHQYPATTANTTTLVRY
ncbi:uncharacterized protein [Lolium perenne]|uniref:uncharacterized protein n=1 Tax=Lolium perenne TaxID=4522 RepID=UPI0021EA82B1|nr:uncharacterized protein LOC127325784 [Lolium perenne]